MVEWSLLFSICTGDGAHAQHTLIWQQLTACEYARPECQGPSEPEGSALNSPRTSHTSAAAPCHVRADLAGDPLPQDTAALLDCTRICTWPTTWAAKSGALPQRSAWKEGAGCCSWMTGPVLARQLWMTSERGMPGMPAKAARTAQSHAKQRCPH